MPPCAGENLGPYEVRQGRHGHGVSRTDTRLDREVAMKFSSERFRERWLPTRSVLALPFRTRTGFIQVGLNIN